MSEDRILAEQSAGETRPPDAGTPADDFAAKAQAASPEGTLEDFKIPWKEIDASAMKRLDVSQEDGRAQTEAETD